MIDPLLSIYVVEAELQDYESSEYWYLGWFASQQDADDLAAKLNRVGDELTLKRRAALAALEPVSEYDLRRNRDKSIVFVYRDATFRGPVRDHEMVTQEAFIAASKPFERHPMDEKWTFGVRYEVYEIPSGLARKKP